MLLRTGRRWLTAKAMHAAQAAAPLLPSRAIDSLEWFVRRSGPRIPILAGIVAENMRAAGVHEPAVFRAYFEQVARHLANAVRILRDAGRPAAVARLAREQVAVDETVRGIRRHMENGRGVIVAPPHVCNYVLTLVRLGQELPVCVYLRWSKHRRDREMKHAWCRAAGLDVILEPASAADPASRAAACVDALKNGAVLVMTPDIAQKSDEGVAVRLLDREVYLPIGPASISMLAEAPLVPVFGRLDGPAHVITACEPIQVELLTRAQGGRKVAVQRAMQVWANRFEAFLRASPQAWFLWGDSRWTRVFRGDARYVAPSNPDRAEASPQPVACEEETCSR